MKKHKHYNVIRAYADGWKIWSPITLPAFSEQVEYRIVPEDGWLPWYGGECPIPYDQMVKVRFSDNTLSTIRQAREFNWQVDYVAVYRVIEEAPQPKKVKMWQFVYKKTFLPQLTVCFYPTFEEAVKACEGATIIQRADWTEIEVEVEEL